MKKRTLIGAGIMTLIIAGGIMTWDPLPATPGAAALSAAAKNYDAEIIRDAYGIPHIYGARDVDTAYGLGFAHAEDDFDTLQLTLLASRGTLARRLGKAAAPTDYLVNLMNVWDRIEKTYDTDVPQDAKDMSKAYVAGLNLYAAQNPDKIWPGVFPATEQDITAGFMFKSPLFYQFDKQLLSVMGDERMESVAMDPGMSDAFIIGPVRLSAIKHVLLMHPAAWLSAAQTRDYFGYQKDQALKFKLYSALSAEIFLQTPVLSNAVRSFALNRISKRQDA